MNVKEDHIREIFSPYGKIKYINFPVDPRFRLNMGFADVEYETREEAVLAIEGWNGGQLDGEFLVVTFSTKIDRHPVRALDERPGRRAASPNRRDRRASPPRRPIAMLLLAATIMDIQDAETFLHHLQHAEATAHHHPAEATFLHHPAEAFHLPLHAVPSAVDLAPSAHTIPGAGAGAEAEDSEVAALVPVAVALVAVEDPQVDPEEEED
ncbi:RNA-binding protein with serine-rich domain 1, partial [Mortierella antarctica]